MSETFDLTAFIEGSAYPKQDVTLYTNVSALKKAEDLKTASQGIDPRTRKPFTIAPSNEQIASWDAERDLLRAEIEASALIFTLQGMPYREAQEIANIYDEENPATEDEIVDLVLKTIVEVRNSTGAVTTIASKEAFELLQKKLSPLEFNKLIEAVIEVNFTAATYEAGIDAGFPSGSSDVE